MSMRGLKVVRVIRPRRTRGGDFAVVCEMSTGEVGALILPPRELETMLRFLQEAKAQTPQQREETPTLPQQLAVDDDNSSSVIRHLREST